MSTFVRRATPSDADRISEIAASVQVLHAAALPSIFQSNARESFPPALICDLLARPGHYVWLAQADETPSGYLYAERRPATLVKHPVERLYIHQMGVLPSARRHGLGTALLNAAREFAREAGITRLALDVWAFNADAREFYEQHGFVVMRQELWTTVDEGG